jgi:hypothetical protein
MTNYAKLKAKLDEFITATGGAVDAWRLHDLRRSTATHMVRLSVREEVVGRVLNHAVKGVTARVYALHSYAPEKRHALDLWAKEIGRARAVSVSHMAVTVNAADEPAIPPGSQSEPGVAPFIRQVG